MKRYGLVIMVLAIACTNSPRNPPVAADTPKALQENNTSSSLIYKRGQQDLVEILYAEWVQKDSALNTLEKMMDALPGAKDDSLRAYTVFTGKNNEYYENARSVVASMTDSSWRRLADSLVKRSELNYQKQIARHQSVKEKMEQRMTELQNFHALCKLAYTIPIIEKYQENLPALSAMNGYKKQLDSATEKTKRVAMDKLK